MDRTGDSQYVELSDDESQPPPRSIDPQSTLIDETWLCSRKERPATEAIYEVQDTGDEDGSPINICTPTLETPFITSVCPATDLSSGSSSYNEVTVMQRGQSQKHFDPLHLDYLDSTSSSNGKKSSGDDGDDGEASRLVLYLSPSQSTQRHAVIDAEEGELEQSVYAPCPLSPSPPPPLPPQTDIERDVIPATPDASQQPTGKFDVSEIVLSPKAGDRLAGSSQQESEDEDDVPVIGQTVDSQNVPGSSPKLNVAMTTTTVNASITSFINVSSDLDVTLPPDDVLTASQAMAADRTTVLNKTSSSNSSSVNSVLVRDTVTSVCESDIGEDEAARRNEVAPGVTNRDADVTSCVTRETGSHSSSGPTLSSIETIVTEPRNLTAPTTSGVTIHDIVTTPIISHSGQSPTSRSLHTTTESLPRGQTSGGQTNIHKNQSHDSRQSHDSLQSHLTKRLSTEDAQTLESIQPCSSSDVSFENLQPIRASTLDDTLIYDLSTYIRPNKASLGSLPSGDDTPATNALTLKIAASSQLLFSTKDELPITKGRSLRGNSLTPHRPSTETENPRAPVMQSSSSSSSNGYEIPCSQRFLQSNIKDPNTISVISPRTPVTTVKRRPLRKLLGSRDKPQRVVNTQGRENEGFTGHTESMDDPTTSKSFTSIISVHDVTGRVVKRLTEKIYRLRVMNTENFQNDKLISQHESEMERTLVKSHLLTIDYDTSSGSGHLADISSSDHGSKETSSSGSQGQGESGAAIRRSISACAPDVGQSGTDALARDENRSTENLDEKSRRSLNQSGSESLFANTPELSKISSIEEPRSADTSLRSTETLRSAETSLRSEAGGHRSAKSEVSHADVVANIPAMVCRPGGEVTVASPASSVVGGGSKVTTGVDHVSVAAVKGRKRKKSDSTAEKHAGIALTSQKKGKKTEKSTSEEHSLEISREMSITNPAAIRPTTTASLEIGVLVMSRWQDGFYYSGTISRIVDSERCEVTFNDGNKSVLTALCVIIADRLPIGQSVLVQGMDGCYDPGIVTGYHGRQEGLGYVVELDDHTSSRYTRGQVILSNDQANCLTGTPPDAPKSPVTPANRGNVSLDNIVDNQRRPKPSTSAQKLPTTPVRIKSVSKKKETQTSAQKLAVTHSSKGKGRGKRAALSGPNEPSSTNVNRGLYTADGVPMSSARKRKMSLFTPQRTSTPTSPNKTLRTHGTSTSVGGVMNSPVAVRRRVTRRAQTGLFGGGKGRMPENKALFRGYTFLLTHADKTDAQLEEEGVYLKRNVSDTSAEESPADEETLKLPFDKDYLERQITTGGGFVLESFDKNLMKADDHCFLVSDTHQRTEKYLQCLAAGVPCVSHNWVINSCEKNELELLAMYLLPAGISRERRSLVELVKRPSPFPGRRVMVVSSDAGTRNMWSSVLDTAKANVTACLPSKAKLDKGIHVIVTDLSCTQAVVIKAHKLGVPLVSTEWCIQSLIERQLQPYTAIPQYSHSYMDTT